ncbi:hypothetical protein DPMN_036768 [Dreissena polymorpha]|uniref:Uncharacterized protein n=1 Tax=Dreissena polymorpha TaxID=45954 RepID=A0A9D4MC40_DREPO|nr:hypothetical protein DPMN_036768 [Dreissena polymorpha]
MLNDLTLCSYAGDHKAYHRPNQHLLHGYICKHMQQNLKSGTKIYRGRGLAENVPDLFGY